jgi:hypothetical protein
LLEPLAVKSPKGVMLIVWEPWMLGYAVALAIGIFVLGLLVFRRSSSRFAEMA